MLDLHFCYLLECFSVEIGGSLLMINEFRVGVPLLNVLLLDGINSILVLGIFTLMGLSLVFALLFVFKKSSQSKEKIATLNQELSVLKSKTSDLLLKEKELETLLSENDELTNQIRNIKIQLIKTAKRSDDKDKLINNLNKKIQKIKDEGQTRTIALDEVLRLLGKPVANSQDTFQIHMDDINQKYIQKLKGIYPNLTMYDLRLCTYIKTGLSTREIAEMMNVLPSSINVSRSRLRKKLALDAKDDLYSFLGNLA